MAKRNGNKKNPAMARRDRPLPSTLPEDLKPYDTNNDGVLSKEERIAMQRAKTKSKLKVDKKGNVSVKVKGKKAVNVSDLKKRN